MNLKIQQWESGAKRGRLITQRSSFSLDATTFEQNGERYLIWAQNVYEKQHGTGLVLSKMKNPTTLEGPEISDYKPRITLGAYRL